MTGTPYTPSTNTWHATVQLETDSDVQRATSYNPSAQELADNIAWLRRKTRDRVFGSYADMATNVTDAELYDIAYVVGRGFYHYDTATITTDSPWIVPALGMTEGVWISEFALSLLEGTPTRVKAGLLPNYQTVDLLEAVSAHVVNFHMTNQGSVWTPIQDTSSPAVNLITNITEAHLFGDVIEMEFGPFDLQVTDGDWVGMRARVVQDGVDYYYPIKQTSPYGSVHWHARYLSSSDAAIVVTLEATNSSDHTSQIGSSGGGAGWGLASLFPWMTGKLLRKYTS
jgi:hypothetical protein